MKPAANLKIVHESEVQRQHTRLPVPARITVEGKRYTVKNLSSGGVSVQGVAGEFERGKRVRMHLGLPLEGFGLDINLTGEVRYYDAVNNVLGCSFNNLTRDQISLLNHILKSFIAGDIVASNDLLNIASRNNFANPRKQEEKPAYAPSLWRQLPGLAAVALAGFLILFFIAGNLYNSLFFVRSSAASVSGPTFDVKASADGIYRSRVDEGSVTVSKNQEIGSITADNGAQRTALTSPCDCYVVKNPGVDGQFVTNGATLMTLVPVSAKPWIMAEMNPGNAAKMTTDTEAVIRIFGSQTRYNGHIASVESDMSGALREDGQRNVLMRIVPDGKLPIDLVNRPAIVSFKLHSLPHIKFPAADAAQISHK